MFKFYYCKFFWYYQTDGKCVKNKKLKWYVLNVNQNVPSLTILNILVCLTKIWLISKTSLSFFGQTSRSCLVLTSSTGPILWPDEWGLWLKPNTGGASFFLKQCKRKIYFSFLFPQLHLWKSTRSRRRLLASLQACRKSVRFSQRRREYWRLWLWRKAWLIFFTFFLLLVSVG